MSYRSARFFVFFAIIYSFDAAAETVTKDGLSGWDIAMILFVIGMVLSIFHSVKMLRGSSKPGPAYWVKRFEAACSRREPKEAEQALLYWGKTMYAEKAPETLEGLATHMEGESVREQVRLLQDVCHKENPPDWNAYLCGQVVASHLYTLSKKEVPAD